MLTRLTISSLIAINLAACGGTGTTTQDVQVAAIERARQELSLPADVPLTATVWTGRERNGQMTYCGSVSSTDGAASAIRPQQFAAHGDPLNFFIFGDAHQTDPQTQPGKFENWSAVCSGAQAA